MRDAKSPNVAHGQVMIVVPRPQSMQASGETYYAQAGQPFTPPPTRPITVNDYSPNGAPVVVGIVPPPPEQGTFTLNPDNTFTYEPPTSGFFGDVQVSYIVQDPLTGVNTTAVVTIKVAPPTAPIVRDDRYSCAASQPCAPATSVLANDTSRVSSKRRRSLAATRTVVFAGVEMPPSVGAVTFNEDGTFIYTPPM